MRLAVIFSATILTLISVAASGQAPRSWSSYNLRNTDVSKIDLEALKKKIDLDEKKLDSLRSVMKTDSLNALYQYASSDLKDYSGSALSIDFITTDYKAFNEALVSNNMEPLPDRGRISFSYGTSHLINRFYFEYLVSIFTNQSTTKDNIKVKVGGLSLLNMNFGYDLLYRNRWSLIPMIGINQQYTKLSLRSTNDQPDPPAGSIFQMVNEYNEVRLRQNSWRVSGSLELDYRVSYVPRESAVVLGFRYGISKSIYDGDYKNRGTQLDYDPKISLRDAYFSVILKFTFPGFRNDIKSEK